MIKIVRGNIFDSNAEALVNPVNCVGVSGKGLAAEFKERWPGVFHEYRRACAYGVMRVGRVYPIFLVGSNRYIICFPTKQHWRSKSQLEWIKSGVRSLRLNIEDLDVRSIAIPALGCGLGGLDWGEVKEVIVGGLEGLDGVEILIYEPQR